MSDNCIGQTVYFKRSVRSSEVLSGKLLSWSMSHVEFESGPGHFPVAVVRCYANNQVIVVNATLVSFDRQTVYGEPGSATVSGPAVTQAAAGKDGE